MSVKLVAIGNLLMMDDGIGIRVAQVLQKKLENRGVEIIIGETDAEYCLSRIIDHDFMFILDSTYFGYEPGSITIIPINDAVTYDGFYSQHQMNLIKLMRFYDKPVQGFIIGIEAYEVRFGMNLSEQIEKNLKHISKAIIQIIDLIMEVMQMHDTFLFKNISVKLTDICHNNNIYKIKKLHIVVNHHSHVTQETLHEFLKTHNEQLVDDWTEIIVERQSIEELTAIIKSIEGDKLEE